MSFLNYYLIHFYTLTCNVGAVGRTTLKTLPHTLLNCVHYDNTLFGEALPGTSAASKSLVLLDNAIINLWLYYGLLILEPEKTEDTILTGMNINYYYHTMLVELYTYTYILYIYIYIYIYIYLTDTVRN